MSVYDVAVVGGGASGLISAIFAAEELGSGKVIILERNDRVGKKILSTGNGRCNFTNMEISSERYHGTDVEFILKALNKLDLNTTLEFFEKLGILARTEGKNKVFPNSLQAASVLDMLRLKAETLGVKEECNFKCENIYQFDEAFKLVSSSGKTIRSKKVIVACGGAAAPNMGTDGSGYSLLEKFGHKKTKLSPALVQLKCPPKSVLPMKGVKLDANVSVFVESEFVKSAFGELLFTEYGISGPSVFDISREASVALDNNKRVYVSVDLMPMFTKEELLAHLKQRNKNMTADMFLNGMINKLLGKQLLKKAGVEKLNIMAYEISDDTLEKLAVILKNCRFEINGTNSWKNAQVTAGGIKTDKFNPETMESLLCSGLYACGEILDIDGDCGGFNLQWAWSSGAVAGISASKSIKEE